MFLLNRWKDLFSRTFYQKAESYTGGSSFGFFIFWNILFAVLGSVLALGVMTSLSNTLVSSFENDFPEFLAMYSDETLVVEGLPLPFVLSEFVNSDGEKYQDLIPEEVFLPLRDGVREGIVSVNSDYPELENFEFVIDTNNELFANNYDELPVDRIGLYLFANDFVYVNPYMYEMVQSGEINLSDLNLPENISELSEEAFPTKIVSTYADAELPEFRFDKEFLIGQWDRYDGWVIGFMGMLVFSLLFVGFVVLRTITNVWWSLIAWGIASLFGYKVEFGRMYLSNLHVMVLVTLLELILMSFVWMGVLFSTFGFVVFLSIVYSSIYMNKPNSTVGELKQNLDSNMIDSGVTKQ